MNYALIPVQPKYQRIVTRLLGDLPKPLAGKKNIATINARYSRNFTPIPLFWILARVSVEFFTPMRHTAYVASATVRSRPVTQYGSGGLRTKIAWKINVPVITRYTDSAPIICGGTSGMSSLKNSENHNFFRASFSAVEAQSVSIMKDTNVENMRKSP